MPITDNLPAEYVDPWYSQFLTTWNNLKSFVNGLETTLSGKVDTSTKGAANGVASLGSDGKVPAAQLPAASGGSGSGVPAGGTTGQTLRKTSNVDGAVAWQTFVKADVGLGNADNTSDLNKPVSTAQQTAIDAKAALASPAFTGNPTAPTPATSDNDTSIATTAFVQSVIGSAGVADSRVIEMDSGTYTFPSTLPAGVKRINTFGTEAPDTSNIVGGALPSYIGTGTGKARLNYEYDPRLS